MTRRSPSTASATRKRGRHLSEAVAMAWQAFDRAADRTCRVTPAVPILFFGDLDAFRASPLRVVTVGLNPSLHEFPTDEPFRRFPIAEGSRDRLAISTQYQPIFVPNRTPDGLMPLSRCLAGWAQVTTRAPHRQHFILISARRWRRTRRGANSTRPIERRLKPTAVHSGAFCWRNCGRRSWGHLRGKGSS